MGDSRRILTVSYGAFSCTLEGYDDPAGTLGAMAAALSEVIRGMPSFGMAHMRTEHAAQDNEASQREDVEPHPMATSSGSLVRSDGAGSGRNRTMKLRLMRNGARAPGVETLARAAILRSRRAVARHLSRAAVEPASRAAPVDGPEGTAPDTGAPDTAAQAATPPAPAPDDVHGGAESVQDDIPVSRLMDVADSKLSGADLKRRRDALTQVKAAVAATRANRSPVRSSQSPEEPAQTGRGTEPRGATNETGPEPRAASSSSDSGMEASGSGEAPSESEIFEAFVWRAAPRGLEEMMECAGAYASFVRAQAHFSPPQLLHLVRLLDDFDTLPTAHGLDAFAALVQQGRFLKDGRERFTLSQSSRFTPEGRRDASAP